MMRDDSDWIRDLFSASVRNWTPASARDAACVLFAPFSPDPEATRRCASILSDRERQRADLFVTDDGKAHFLQRRAFRRYCGARALRSQRPLSRIDFKATDKGRPYLPDLPDVWFSFSACPFGFLGAWSSTHRIGVDLEDHTRDLEVTELAQRYFSQAEASAVTDLGGEARRRTFFQLWSLKEAALKSIGEGLPFGLHILKFELVPRLRMVDAPLDYGGPERFAAHVIEGTDHCAALVTHQRDCGLPNVF